MLSRGIVELEMQLLRDFEAGKSYLKAFGGE